MAAGAVLLAGALFGAVHFGAHPGSTLFDRWGFDAIVRSPRSWVLIRITDLASPLVLVVATVLAGAVALRHDRARSLSCLLGPVVVAVAVELVLKPIVGRHYQGVLSYPSGSVSDVAAVATAWTIAVPRGLRLPVAAVGALATTAMTVAVVALRWHYPSDALGGVLVGVGVVLCIDGALHLRFVDAQPRPSH